MMITREILLETMKEDKELEKLVVEFGGVDRAVAAMNIFTPVFEGILKGISDFVEEIKDGFVQSKEERLAQSFIDDVNAAIDEYGEDVVFEHKEEDIFNKALNMCDVDVEWRYSYLDELLCNLQDESMELYEELEKAKVDEEIAQRLIDDYDFDARKDLIYANKRIISLNKELEENEYKIEATNDLYDEVFFNVIANLE